MEIKVYQEFYDGQYGSVFKGPFTIRDLRDPKEFESVNMLETSEVLDSIEDVKDDIAFRDFQKDLSIFAEKVIVWSKSCGMPGNCFNQYQLIQES